MPIYNIFKKLCEDEKDRSAYTASATSGGYYSSSTAVKTYTTENANGTYTSYSYTAQDPQEENIYNSTATEKTVPSDDKETEAKPAEVVESKKEFNLKEILNTCQSEHNFFEKLLNNMKAYCAAAAEASKKRDISNVDSKKLSLVFEQSTHSEEISKRLALIQFFSSQSDSLISKVELRVIYDLLAQSPIKTDVNEFLVWLKEACASQTSTAVVFDIQQVGQFFTELIDTKALDVISLPMVGFEFLKNYIIQLNEQQHNLIILPKPIKKVQ